jgi:hypothetical protein
MHIFKGDIHSAKSGAPQQMKIENVPDGQR